jgi:hypothetical protein
MPVPKRSKVAGSGMGFVGLTFETKRMLSKYTVTGPVKIGDPQPKLILRVCMPDHSFG